MPNEQTYSIYAAEKRSRKANNVIEDFLFRGKRHHSFLVLANDNTQQATAELHFLSRTANKRYPTNKLANVFYSADYVACLVGVQEAFHKAAETVGLKNYPLYLRALEKEVDTPLAEYNQQKIISGSKSTIDDLWLNCSHRALMISQADLKYRPIGTVVPTQNCRSGTQDLVESLGGNFTAFASSDILPHIKVGANNSITKAFGEKSTPPPPSTTIREVSKQLDLLRGAKIS